jgi:hypothetical protein
MIEFEVIFTRSYCLPPQVSNVFLMNIIWSLEQKQTLDYTPEY